MRYEEKMSIIRMIERDIAQYKGQLKDWYNHEEGIDNILDWETVIYYEQELIPRLELELEDLRDCF